MESVGNYYTFETDLSKLEAMAKSLGIFDRLMELKRIGEEVAEEG